MKLRKPDCNDVPAIAALHMTAWQQGYKGIMPSRVLDNLSLDGITSRWHERIAHPKNNEHARIILRQEQMLGFVTFGASRESMNLPQDFGEIYALYVHPDYWRIGAGKALIQYAFTWFDAHQFPGVFLWTLKENQRARKFYERMGMCLIPQERYLSIHGEEMLNCCYCNKSIL